MVGGRVGVAVPLFISENNFVRELSCRFHTGWPKTDSSRRWSQSCSLEQRCWISRSRPLPAGGSRGSFPSPLTTGWLLIFDGATLAVSVIRVEVEGLENVIEVETEGVVGEEFEEEVVVGMLGGALLLGFALGFGIGSASAIGSSAGDVGESTGEVGE